MNLPALNFLAARSFWAALIAAAAAVNGSLGLVPVFDVEATTDAVMAAVSLVAGVVAYQQRATPGRSITFTGPLS